MCDKARAAPRQVFAACGYARDGSGVCYLANDGAAPFRGAVVVEAVDLASGDAVVVLNETAALPAGPGVPTCRARERGALHFPQGCSRKTRSHHHC